MSRFNTDQQRAIDSTGNVIVSAGAGSGKTSVLTTRICENIVKKGIKLDEILILTFTKDAANEMKTRLKAALSENKSTRNLVPLVDGANISTFDSYFLNLVKKYYYRLDVPSTIDNIPDDVIYIKKYETLKKIFEERAKSHDPLFKKLINNYCQKSESTLFKFIMSIDDELTKVNDRDKYLNDFYDNFLSDDALNKFFKESLDKIVQEFVEEFDRSSYKISTRYYEKVCEWTEFDSLSKNPTFKNVYESGILESKGKPRPSKKDDADKSLKDYNGKLFTDFRKLFRAADFKTYENNFYNVDVKNNQELIPYILDIVKELNDRVYEFKSNLGFFTFSDIAKMALKLIKENEDIRNSIKNKLKLIMIDEYQDTSIAQEEFISLIDNNNVFVVGDVKQSIYGFRDANPKQFIDRYNKFKDPSNPGEAIDMNVNYRSRKEVNDAVNELFSELMTEDVGGADYRKGHIIQTGNNIYESNKDVSSHQYGIFKFPIDLSKYKNDKGKIIETSEMEEVIEDESESNKEEVKLSADQKKEIEADYLAQDIIKRINNGYKVFDKDKGELRPIEFKDITILICKKTDFDVIEKKFSEYGIPLNSVKDNEIRTNTAVVVLTNIFKMINEFNKPIEDKEKQKQTLRHAFASLLRSFLYEYKDQDLYDLFSDKKGEDAYLNNEIYIDIKNFAKETKDDLLSDIFLKSIKKFKIIEKLYKLDKNAIETSKYIELFYNRTKVMEQLNYTLDQFILFLESLDDLSIEMNVRKTSEAENVVTLTTIHKSKGLEYNVVYLPYLFFGVKGNDSYPAGFYINKAYGFFLPSLYFINDDKNKCLHYIFRSKFESNNQYNENMRLFYVALTRAKEEVIIPITSIDEEKMSFKDAFTTKERVIRSRNLGEIFYAATNFINKHFKDVPSMKLKYEPLKETKQKIQADELILKKDFKYEFEKIEKVSKASKDLKLGTDLNKLQYGTYIHLLMEIVDFVSKDTSFISDEKEKVMVDNVLKQPIFNKVNEGEVYKEYEFYDDENRKNGIIDLLIVYNDKVDIIDYKLKNIEDDAYIKQLNIYRKYIKKAFEKENVNCYLLSIIDNKLEVVPEE